VLQKSRFRSFWAQNQQFWELWGSETSSLASETPISGAFGLRNVNLGNIWAQKNPISGVFGLRNANLGTFQLKNDNFWSFGLGTAGSGGVAAPLTWAGDRDPRSLPPPPPPPPPRGLPRPDPHSQLWGGRCREIPGK